MTDNWRDFWDWTTEIAQNWYKIRQTDRPTFFLFFLLRLGVCAASSSAYSGYPELWILRYPAHRYRAVPSPGIEPTTLSFGHDAPPTHFDRCCILRYSWNILVVLAGHNYIEVWEISVAGYLLSWYFRGIGRYFCHRLLAPDRQMMCFDCVLIFRATGIGVSKSGAYGRVLKPTDAQLWLK
jgi:hypothetical protein